jgi:hypothetical protein
MAEDSGSSGFAHLTRGALPIILLAAVVQGWTLYALHMSIERNVWPATEPGVLAALYAMTVFVPLTVQMLVQHVRRRVTWMFVAALAAFYLLIGWHHGEWVLDESRDAPDGWFAPAAIVAIQWLLIMPFLQARLIEGRWRSRYELLFSSAWTNKLVLGEAAVFTGFFWLLLFLWAQLFGMLGIEFFEDLFQEPVFVYPVTSIVFGVALKLIGSLERLTTVVLEQTLSVLKWLALLAGLILALFTVALVFKLPGLVASGEKAIAAVWLLWLIAGTVLLVNAAYRDGSLDEPYPRLIGIALRFAIPLTVVSALVAAYALWLRVDQYGFTVSRFWGWVVAVAALLYSVGYALAARHNHRWMRSIAGVNVVVALYLIGVLTLALTPVLSPYRIAANSQFAMALEAPAGSSEASLPYTYTHMSYLRFDSGRYGRNRVEELSRIENHPRAEDLRREAKAALAREQRWSPPQYDSSIFEGIVVQPPGRTLDPQLVELLTSNQSNSGLLVDQSTIAGVFVDLNDDRVEEFVLLANGSAVVYRFESGTWRYVGHMTNDGYEAAQTIVSRVRQGDVRTEPSVWKDLLIGNLRYRMPPGAP